MRINSSTQLTKLRSTVLYTVALLLVLLNVVRPFDWMYRFRADVIASESRVSRLYELAGSSSFDRAIRLFLRKHAS